MGSITKVASAHFLFAIIQKKFFLPIALAFNTKRTKPAKELEKAIPKTPYGLIRRKESKVPLPKEIKEYFALFP